MRMRLVVLAAALSLALLVPGAASAADSFPLIQGPGLFPLQKGGFNENPVIGDAGYVRQPGPLSVFRSGNRFPRGLDRSTRARAGVPGNGTGFRWNRGDQGVDYWYPQGLTGSADAGPNRARAYPNALVTSWYDGKGNRARLSFVSNLRKDRKLSYRHVLLVEPDGNGGYTNADTHAGGLAWYRNRLYVADTSGIRVFDMRQIYRVKPGNGRSEKAGNYAFVMPQIGRYSSPSLRISYVAVDATGPPALVAGQYAQGADAGGNIARYRLDSASGDLVAGPGGRVDSVTAFRSSRGSLQGAVTRGRNVWVSGSAGENGRGRLIAGTIGGRELRSIPWLVGAEDVMWANGRIYSLSEYPDNRVVISVPAS